MTNAPIEAKVKSATAATFVASFLIAVLNSVVADDTLFGPLPGWLQALVIALAPAGLTFLASWSAAHTPRGPRAES